MCMPVYCSRENLEWFCVVCFVGVYDSVGVANKGLVYTLFARQVATSEELSFEEGELLKVLERGGGSRGNQWWLAECADGSEGRVPCTHLGITGRYRQTPLCSCHALNMQQNCF